MERRSIRKYQPQQITADELDVILQTGLYAPNAGGQQSVIIAVCQNEKTNAELGRINKAALKRPGAADDPASGSAFYGAPTVLFLFGPDDFSKVDYGVEPDELRRRVTIDCSLAAENIMLAAHSLGIGSCMIMRAEETLSSELGKKCLKEWAVPEDYKARAIVILGYPDGEIPAAKPRKENRIRIIR
jgi:nitroreductase